MSRMLNARELAITIAAKNLNPTALNPDFLKYSGIVPEDWELARPPVYTNELVQFLFQTGVAIVVQPNRIIFAQALKDEFPQDVQQDVQVAAIAERYVERLPNVDYQAVGINPTGYVTFPKSNGAYQYFADNILAPGDWQKIGQSPVKASVQLSYTLERGELNLTINEAALQLAEEQPLPAVLFSGNFNYEIVGSDRPTRLKDTQRLIENWQAASKAFHELINSRFLQQTIPAIAG